MDCIAESCAWFMYDSVSKTCKKRKDGCETTQRANTDYDSYRPAGYFVKEKIKCDYKYGNFCYSSPRRTLISENMVCGNSALETGPDTLNRSLDECEMDCIAESCVWFQYDSVSKTCAKRNYGCETTKKVEAGWDSYEPTGY